MQFGWDERLLSSEQQTSNQIWMNDRPGRLPPSGEHLNSGLECILSGDPAFLP